MATRKTATPATKAPAKKAPAKKAAAKKTPAKKAAAKKQAAAQADLPTATEAAAKAPVRKKPAAKKVAARKPYGKRGAPAPGTNPLYMGKDEYNATIQGLVDQGLDREDAVLTLKVGMRQANGKPLPQELLMQCNGDPRIAFDAQPVAPTETPAVNDEAAPEERNAA